MLNKIKNFFKTWKCGFSFRLFPGEHFTLLSGAILDFNPSDEYITIAGIKLGKFIIELYFEKR
jgi:hypothetical protein